MRWGGLQPASVAWCNGAAPAKPGLSEPDRAVEALVAQRTIGAVTDAAWAAAHRLFQPASRGQTTHLASGLTFPRPLA